MAESAQVNPLNVNMNVNMNMNMNMGIHKSIYDISNNHGHAIEGFNVDKF